MGCYMSQPDEKVYVSEGKGKNYTYATASCQGWRREQEDAEACLPYFDDDASLFILCDGHGGAEVAKYTVKHFPDFIRNHHLCKRAFNVIHSSRSEIKFALEQAFIDFDALLRTDKVMAELQKLASEDNDTNIKKLCGDSDDGKEKFINEGDNAQPPAVESSAGHTISAAGTSTSSNNGSSTVVEDVDIGTLRREARVSLSELLGEYTSMINSESNSGRSHLFSKAFPSPTIRKKEDPGEANDDNGEACTSTSSGPQDKQLQPSSSRSEDGEPSQGPSTSTDAQFNRKDLMKQVLDRYFQGIEDSSDDSEYEEDSNDEDDDGDDEGDDDAGYIASKKLRRKKHKRPVGERIDSSTDDDDDDDYGADDQDDEDENDDDDDSEQDADQEQEDDDEEDEGDVIEDEDDEIIEDEDDEIIEDDENWKTMQDMITPGARTHKPGFDSGCTVLVALIIRKELYVASAGDSRCIVILRDGECFPMSFDHKPEDYKEEKRIKRAGGKVVEGRVNGGLNLSRAFGDFTYKQSDLMAGEQMITPIPSVRDMPVNPRCIEYIFLACDGIWNSMKNREVSDFIRKTAQSSDNNLVDISIKLFRKCIAPRTDGDGTGCDNMTCIILRFDYNPNDSASSDLKNSEVKEQSSETKAEPTSSSSQKRSFSEESSTADGSSIKRRCLRL